MPDTDMTTEEACGVLTQYAASAPHDRIAQAGAKVVEEYARLLLLWTAQTAARARAEAERDALRGALEQAENIVIDELDDWGDGGEMLRSGKRLRVFLRERCEAILARLADRRAALKEGKG